ncbi:MAG: AgmX/PglI C-terminal domain-containing protein [Deltaproteobacteria bacterium]|nr:AgmX/PglI C-terminal domain-containing protein [Deltaproteobacteria bacterium]
MKSVFEQQYADSFTRPAESEPSFFDIQVSAVEADINSDINAVHTSVDAVVGRSLTGFSDKEHSHWDVPSRLSRLSTFLPEQFVSGKRWVGWLISFIAGIGIGALVVFLVMSAMPPKTVVKEKLVTKTEIVYRDRPLSESGDMEETDALSGSGRDKVARGSRQGKKARSATRAERKQELLANLNVDARRKSAGSGGAKRQGLTATELNRVVTRHRSSLQQCYERALKSGTAPTSSDLKATFHVTVGKSGTVTGVRVTGPGARIPTLNNCMGGAIKRWVFPPATDSSSVQFPIVFTPSR